MQDLIGAQGGEHQTARNFLVRPEMEQKYLAHAAMADQPSTSQKGQLIIFDLIAPNQDWNVQTLFDFIAKRFESIKMDKSSFNSVCQLQI